MATGGVGAAAWKKESCIDTSASARGVVDEEPSVEGLAPGAGSGALPTIESADNQSGSPGWGYM